MKQDKIKSGLIVSTLLISTIALSSCGTVSRLNPIGRGSGYDFSIDDPNFYDSWYHDRPPIIVSPPPRPLRPEPLPTIPGPR